MICKGCGKDVIGYTALGITSPVEHECPAMKDPYLARAEKAEACVAEQRKRIEMALGYCETADLPTLAAVLRGEKRWAPTPSVCEERCECLPEGHNPGCARDTLTKISKAETGDRREKLASADDGCEGKRREAQLAEATSMSRSPSASSATSHSDVERARAWFAEHADGEGPSYGDLASLLADVRSEGLGDRGADHDRIKVLNAEIEVPNRINPGARIYIRGAPSSRGTVDGWIGASQVRVAWDSGHWSDVVAASLILISRTDNRPSEAEVEIPNEPQAVYDRFATLPKAACDRSRAPRSVGKDDAAPTYEEGLEAVAQLGIDIPAYAAEIRSKVAAAIARTPCVAGATGRRCESHGLPWYERLNGCLEGRSVV